MAAVPAHPEARAARAAGEVMSVSDRAIVVSIVAGLLGSRDDANLGMGHDRVELVAAADLIVDEAVRRHPAEDES